MCGARKRDREGGNKGVKGEGDTLVMVETNKQKPYLTAIESILIKERSTHPVSGSRYKEYRMDTTPS